jgi:hypothetical protein
VTVLRPSTIDTLCDVQAIALLSATVSSALMRKSTIVSGLLALTFCSGLHAAGASLDSAYTEYDYERCPHRAGRDVEDYGEWRCKGLNGITVLISAGDQRTTMSFGPRAGSELAAAQTLRGFNSIARGRIEWRVTLEGGRRNHPFAVILRWTTSVVDQRGSAEEAVKGKVLVVTRLAPGGVCHIGYVDALANANANELARKIADGRAGSFRCNADKPVIVGATGPGFSSSDGAVRDVSLQRPGAEPE